MYITPLSCKLSRISLAAAVSYSSSASPNTFSPAFIPYRSVISYWHGGVNIILFWYWLILLPERKHKNVPFYLLQIVRLGSRLGLLLLLDRRVQFLSVCVCSFTPGLIDSQLLPPPLLESSSSSSSFSPYIYVSTNVETAPIYILACQYVYWFQYAYWHRFFHANMYIGTILAFPTIQPNLKNILRIIN